MSAAGFCAAASRGASSSMRARTRAKNEIHAVSAAPAAGPAAVL